MVEAVTPISIHTLMPTFSSSLSFCDQAVSKNYGRRKNIVHPKNVNRCDCHTEVFLVENWNSDCTEKTYNEFVDTKSCVFYQRQ